jgi:hypothetical protein
MRFIRLGESTVVNADRVICVKTLKQPDGKAYAIGITYDTGQTLILEDSDPVAVVGNYLESLSAEPTATI